MILRGQTNHKPLLRKVRRAFFATKDAIYAFLLWLLGNILWDLVLVGILGSTVSYLARKKSEWATPILYFLITACCVFVIAYTLVGRALLIQEQPKTNPENVESNIKAWADRFSLGVQKQSNDKFVFVYRIALQNGRTILVGRPKEREGYLQFQGDMQLAAEHEAAFNKLPLSKQVRISDEISLDMARNKTGFIVVGAPLKGIVVSKAIPITSNLTEDSFIDALNEIDSSMLLAREAMRLAFFRNGISDVMPHPAP